MSALRTKTRAKLAGPGLRRRARAFAAAVTADLVADAHVERLGDSAYGAWAVPVERLVPGALCYCAGAGEDIGFEVALARRGCEVHAFDPVPAALRHAGPIAAAERGLTFHPIGLWSSDETLVFHEPVVPGYVSHSATDLHGTAPAFEARVRSVRSLMDELGHDRLALLKLSVEGSEYEILRHVLDEDIDVEVLAVEFAQPGPRGAPQVWLAHLAQRGYVPVDVSARPRDWSVTLRR